MSWLDQVVAVDDALNAAEVERRHYFGLWRQSDYGSPEWRDLLKKLEQVRAVTCAAEQQLEALWPSCGYRWRVQGRSVFAQMRDDVARRDARTPPSADRWGRRW